MHEHAPVAADPRRDVDRVDHVVGGEAEAVRRRQRGQDRHRRVRTHVHLAEVRVGGEALLRVAGGLTLRTRREREHARPLAALHREVVVHVVGLHVEDELFATECVERGFLVDGRFLRNGEGPARRFTATRGFVLGAGRQHEERGGRARGAREEPAARHAQAARVLVRQLVGTAHRLADQWAVRDRVELAVRHRSELDREVVGIRHCRASSVHNTSSRRSGNTFPTFVRRYSP